LRSLPSKRPERRQHFLKAPSGTARTQVVAPELLDQLLVAMHDAVAAPYLRFGGIALASAYARFRKDGSWSDSSRRMEASSGWDLRSPPPPRLRRASCFAARADPAKRAARSRMVRAVGFEPTTSWFQARSAAGLRHALRAYFGIGPSSRTRTCDLPVRNRVLSSTELWMDSADRGLRTEDRGRSVNYCLSSVIRRLSSELAPVAGIEPAYSPLNRRRRAPCSALTGMMEHHFQ
jgi:hypothetical protein